MFLEWSRYWHEFSCDVLITVVIKEISAAILWILEGSIRCSQSSWREVYLATVSKVHTCSQCATYRYTNVHGSNQQWNSWYTIVKNNAFRVAISQPTALLCQCANFIVSAPESCVGARTTFYVFRTSKYCRWVNWFCFMLVPLDTCLVYSQTSK